MRIDSWAIVDLVTIVDYPSAAEPLQLRLDLLQCQCLEAKADAFQHPNACATFIGVELAGFHPAIKSRTYLKIADCCRSVIKG
jgi:hypothetical protein